MTFGIFQRKQLSISDVQELVQIFRNLKDECPGGAFMFAQSLGYCVLEIKNARQAGWPIKAVLQDLASEHSKTFAIDKGTRMLAVQTMQRLNRSRISPEAHSSMDMILDEIMIEGVEYRSLQDGDSQPPSNDVQKGYLDHVKLRCLADILEAEGLVGKPEEDDDEFFARRYRVIATFDMMAEWQDGPLKDRLLMIDTWTKS